MKCEFCDPGPCRFPTFCRIAEDSFETLHDRTARGELPSRWWEMSEAQLGRWLDAKWERRRLARAPKEDGDAKA